MIFVFLYLFPCLFIALLNALLGTYLSYLVVSRFSKLLDVSDREKGVVALNWAFKDLLS